MIHLYNELSKSDMLLWKIPSHSPSKKYSLLGFWFLQELWSKILDGFFLLLRFLILIELIKWQVFLNAKNINFAWFHTLLIFWSILAPKKILENFYIDQTLSLAWKMNSLLLKTTFEIFLKRILISHFSLFLLLS